MCLRTFEPANARSDAADRAEGSLTMRNYKQVRTKLLIRYSERQAGNTAPGKSTRSEHEFPTDQPGLDIAGRMRRGARAVRGLFPRMEARQERRHRRRIRSGRIIRPQCARSAEAARGQSRI